MKSAGLFKEIWMCMRERTNWWLLPSSWPWASTSNVPTIILSPRSSNRWSYGQVS
jgi:hypothetical protein